MIFDLEKDLTKAKGLIFKEGKSYFTGINYSKKILNEIWEYLTVSLPKTDYNYKLYCSKYAVWPSEYVPLSEELVVGKIETFFQVNWSTCAEIWCTSSLNKEGRINSVLNYIDAETINKVRLAPCVSAKVVTNSNTKNIIIDDFCLNFIDIVL